MLCFHGMNYLPVLLVVLTATTFVVTYIWAIAKKDVNPYFPYIRYAIMKISELLIIIKEII